MRITATQKFLVIAFSVAYRLWIGTAFYSHILPKGSKFIIWTDLNADESETPLITAIGCRFLVEVWGLRGDDGGGGFVVGAEVEEQGRTARAEARASPLFNVRLAARVNPCP
jgi:hypothetical protein